jgi:hypothetical protein
MLSNQKIINEIKASQRDFVNTRPEMIFKPFVNNRAERDYNLGDRGRGIMRDVVGGYKSLGQHPRYSNSINGNTAYPDPLLGGAVNRPLYRNYAEFNNRGGALLEENMPLTGGYHSDSDFHSESDDECSSSEYETESEYESECDDMEGAGVYKDYIEPVGKTLLNVGHEVFKDVVVPVGKELLKDAIIGLMSGAGMKGGKITGTKTEFIHILKKINPKIRMNELKKKTQHELARELYKILELGMHPEDLKSLHLLDAYTKASKRGGLGGTQKELQKILVAMYPKLNLENLSKQEIIDKIKGHVDKTESSRIKTNEKRKGKRKTTKNFSSLPEYFEPEPKKIDFIPEELPSEEIEEEIFQEPETKQTKKRGRPKGEPKVKAEPKKRGRPTKEKVAKEPKKRGRPKAEPKPKTEPKKRGRKPKSKVEELDEMFKNILDKKEDIIEPITKNIKVKINKKKKEGAGIKKIVGTKKGEKVRGDIVAEVMKKQGLSLGQASKYVSEHNLY